MTNFFKNLTTNWSLKRLCHSILYALAISIAAGVVAACYAAMPLLLSYIFIQMLLRFAYLVPYLLVPYGIYRYWRGSSKEEFAETIVRTFKYVSKAITTLAYSCYHNFRRLTLELANFLLTKFGLAPVSLGMHLSMEEIRQMRLTRNRSIEFVKARYEADSEYENHFAAISGCINQIHKSVVKIYERATESFVAQALEEYMLFISEKKIDVESVFFERIRSKIDYLQSWYILRTRRRLICWTLAKEFTLTMIQENADDLMLYLTEEDINHLESNPKWVCQISQCLMRNPVYVILSNGQRCYYEYLNLAKWMSIPTADENMRERLPETREKITEIFFDCKLKQEILNAVQQIRNGKIALPKDIPKPKSHRELLISYYHNCIDKTINVIDLMLSKAYEASRILTSIPAVTRTNSQVLLDPYSHVVIDNYEELAPIDKVNPMWYTVYDPRSDKFDGVYIYICLDENAAKFTKMGSIFEQMLALEAMIKIVIVEFLHYEERGNDVVPVNRTLIARSISNDTNLRECEGSRLFFANASQMQRPTIGFEPLPQPDPYQHYRLIA